MTNMDPNLKIDYKTNKSQFESKLDSLNKELTTYERLKEKKFKREFKAEEKAREASEGLNNYLSE